ncbi:probable LRR receptor-like serine/threonine-protein kinase At3g47570 isoform X1 [Carica papaya]|uniref:probable LRR receptor-like serine/threonine-protein kinase At3g47570 isoform X1 n=1 Tax=Carica papaya TaxID=3649 RepID=UPI000B8D03F2|nr:probable LRR receptor-like serine/threonine-protein kinase At3g47570 isoform X1 [Carica papaya]XP_021903993.1 probable LRR receptor-like serine/threonine-protein kinase At3g47570 isoform X1 [Carica papaya]
MSLWMFWLIYMQVFQVSLGSSIHQGNNTDKLSLLHFKAKVHDPLGVLSSWNESIQFCEWYGVSCGHKHQRVTALNLRSSKLVAVNQFSGRAPNFTGFNDLQYLNWEANNLGNGEDDDLQFLYSIVNCSSLRGLSFESNNLGGILPRIIGNFSNKLSELGLGDNQIRGSIPSEIENLIGLTRLSMKQNRLSGSIPSSIGKLQSLGFLDIYGNEFSGSIPSSIGNITTLQILDLSFNNLLGIIPSTLEKCQRLFLIQFSNNKLSGKIPIEVMGISSLSWALDLSNNQLVGSVPAEVGELVHLGILDLSHNKLTGEIPATLGSCTSLESLYLDDNFLQGNIPKALDSLKGIRKLGFSLNNLSGKIPEFLRTIKLQSLNLSFNNFEGEVPTEGIFKNASAVSLVGNTNLCGGIFELHLPPCSAKGDKKNGGSSLKLILVSVILSVLLLIVVLSLIIVYYLWKRKLKASSTPPLLVSMLQVSYDNLLKATSGFSSDNLIGKGRYGSVYKGILDYEQQTVVAVKVFNLQHQGATRSFLAECEALRNIRHRNLVKIISACVSIDFQGNDFKALVYDLMVNGNLDEWLHPVNEASEAPRHLHILQRLNIAIDVASALAYLHFHCQPPIVHSDIKPSNVLLDDEMIGHVGDFGLARFLPQETSQNISSNSASYTGILGTTGYTAPEYAMGIKPSTSGDVYSFGILILEIFTGKRPTNEIFKDGFNLHNFVTPALAENLSEIIDPMLLQEVAGESKMWINDEIKQCLVSVFQVGVVCSAEFPNERPSICDVEVQLQSIRKKLVKSRGYRENQGRRKAPSAEVSKNAESAGSLICD